MDRRTRKLMTIHKVLHPRYMYVSRKEGEREIVSIEKGTTDENFTNLSSATEMSSKR